MSIDARDFSSQEAGGFKYGINQESFLAGLKKLVEAVEKKEVMIQLVTSTEVADPQEFVVKDLNIRFSERTPQ